MNLSVVSGLSRDIRDAQSVKQTAGIPGIFNGKSRYPNRKRGADGKLGTGKLLRNKLKNDIGSPEKKYGKKRMGDECVRVVERRFTAFMASTIVTGVLEAEDEQGCRIRQINP